MGVSPMRNREATLLFNNKVLLAAAVRMGETPMPR
jgi:hypothetical protein